jgi:hypothetical protein
LHIGVVSDGLFEVFLEVFAVVDVHEIKKFGINQVLVPPSEKFLDGCAAVEDLASGREDEDDGFGQFGDKEVGPTLSFGKFEGR